MNQILKGMRVIEGSAFVAAPLGGMTLAQMGADVIRFDPIGGAKARELPGIPHPVFRAEYFPSSEISLDAAAGTATLPFKMSLVSYAFP